MSSPLLALCRRRTVPAGCDGAALDGPTRGAVAFRGRQTGRTIT